MDNRKELKSGILGDLSAMRFCLMTVLRGRRQVPLCAFVVGVIDAIHPLLLVFLTGLVVDSIVSGGGAGEAMRLFLLVCLLRFVLSLIRKYAEQLLNRNLEDMYERQNDTIVEKNMEVDYALLEDREKMQVRERILHFNPRFGISGIIVDCLLHMTRVLFSMALALSLMIPRLLEVGRQADGFAGSYWCSGLFLLMLLTAGILDMRFLRKKYLERDEIYAGDKTRLDTRRRFYLNMYRTEEGQKDLRMGKMQALVDQDVREILRASDALHKRVARLSLHMYGVFSLVHALMILSVYLFALILGLRELISAGSVIAFAECIRQVSGSMRDFSDVAAEFQEGAVAARRYHSFMTLPSLRKRGSIPVEKRRDDRFSLEFRHVSFRYPGRDDFAIRDLNLSLEIGEKLAVVGRNGSGKTTFIKLLCRLYAPTEGTILVNGIDIQKYSEEEYRRLFSVVFQDFVLPAFSLCEVVSCRADGDTEVEANVQTALRKAGLREYAETIKTEKDVFVGGAYEPGGQSFSGGEMQKIALSRAICRNAPFVILDEPTAAMDPESECAVFSAFHQVVGRKTAIYISHRLASCRFCEDILVFDGGQVVEHGCHGDLIREDGLYRRLWEAQAQYYAQAEDAGGSS